MYPNRPFSIRQPQGLISGFSRAGALSVKAGSSCVNPVSDAKPHLNPRPSQILRQDLQCVSFHYRKARLRETSWRPYIRNGEFHVGTEDLLQTPSIRRSPKKGGITVPFLFTILPASVILAVHLLSGLRVNQHGSWHEQGKKAMVQVLIRTFLSVIPNSGRCLGNY